MAKRMVPKGTAPSQTFPPHLVWLLAAITLGWGFSWPIMKTVLFEMAPMHFRSVSLFFAAAGLFAIAHLSGFPIRVPQGQWPRLIAIALINMMVWNILTVYGLRLMASGRAVILGYTMPIWGMIFAIWFLKEPFTRRGRLARRWGAPGCCSCLGRRFGP